MDTLEDDDFWAVLKCIEEEDGDVDQYLSQLSMSQPNFHNATAPPIDLDPQGHYYESIGGATALIPPPEPYYVEVLESEDHSEQVPMREVFIPGAVAAMPPPVPPRTRFLSARQQSFQRPLSCDFSRKVTRANTSVDSGEFTVSSTSDRRVAKKKYLIVLKVRRGSVIPD